jgi:hypothetical protein
MGMSSRRRKLAEKVAATGHELKPLDIVLMNTRAGAAYGTRLTSIPAADSGARLRYGCSSAACGCWEPTGGVGTLRSPLRAADFWNRGTRRSFGKATRRVSTSGIARLKSWRTWNSCRRPVSWSRVFRSRSRRVRGLHARRGDPMTSTTSEGGAGFFSAATNREAKRSRCR